MVEEVQGWDDKASKDNKLVNVDFCDEKGASPLAGMTTKELKVKATKLEKEADEMLKAWKNNI